MKLLAEYSRKKDSFDFVDGIVLPLRGYAVESVYSYSLEEILSIVQNTEKEVFIKINKNLWNDDIEELKEILQTLDAYPIQGILFYDLAFLQIKKELQLNVPLVWAQTHMVNNYRTCDYYYDKGVEYALLGKEITLEEILEILEKSKISSIVEVVSKPSVAFSKRKLLTHYYQDMKKEKKSNLNILESVSNQSYQLQEDALGTHFFLDQVTNGTSVISSLYQKNCSYIYMKEYGLEDDFEELLKDTKEYIDGECKDPSYVKKYQKLGNSTNFFFQKTIYQVKKHEKN